MSEAEYRRLVGGKGEQEKRPRKPRVSGHDWKLEGSRYVCTCCGMGLSLRFYPHWYMGYWTE